MFPNDIDTVLVRLSDQLRDLSTYIDRHWSDLDVACLARLLSTHGRSAARLGRLLNDRAAIHGPPPDPLQQAIYGALYDLGNERGIHLIDAEDLEVLDRAEAPIDIDDLIADLGGKQARLSQQLSGEPSEDDGSFSQLFEVYSLNAARLGRLFRVRHTLYPRPPEELEAMVKNAYYDDLEAALAETPDEPTISPEQNE